MATMWHWRKLRSRPKPATPSLWELFGPDRQGGPAQVLSLAELAEAARAAKTHRHRRRRGNPGTTPTPVGQPTASGLLAPAPRVVDSTSEEIDRLIVRIEGSLSPDPTVEEITEAATVVFWALTDEERKATSMDELRRRLAV